MSANDWYISAINIQPSRRRIDFVDLRVEQDAALAECGLFPLDEDTRRVPAILIAPNGTPIRTFARLHHQASRNRRTRMWISELPEFVHQFGGDLELVFPVHGRIVVAPQAADLTQALRDLGADLRPTPPIVLVRGAGSSMEGVRLEERVQDAVETPARSAAKRSPREQVLGFAANNGLGWAVRELKARDADLGDVSTFEETRRHLHDAMRTEGEVLRSVSTTASTLQEHFPNIEAVAIHVVDDDDERVYSVSDLERLATEIDQSAEVLMKPIEDEDND